MGLEESLVKLRKEVLAALPEKNREDVLAYCAERPYLKTNTLIGFFRAIKLLNDFSKERYLLIPKPQMVKFYNNLIEDEVIRGETFIKLAKFAIKKKEVTTNEARDFLKIKRFTARQYLKKLAKMQPENFQFTKGISGGNAKVQSRIKFIGKNNFDPNTAGREKKRYNAKSISGYMCSLKVFFKYLSQEEDYPQNIRWFKVDRKANRTTIQESDLLTQEELQKMIKISDNMRTKALISCLYESGCRQSEIRNLKVGNVSWDAYGAVLSVDGKTGRRSVRLPEKGTAVPYLKAWLQVHREKDNLQAPLFYPMSDKSEKIVHISASSFGAMIKILAEKAGIKKRVVPHLFRHTRATELSASGFSEQAQREIFGWKAKSDMPSVYVHLAHTDIDAMFAKMYGMEISKGKKAFKLDVRPCPKRECGKDNPLDAKFCYVCGTPLTAEFAAEKFVELEKKVSKMGEYFEAWMREQERVRTDLELESQKDPEYQKNREYSRWMNYLEENPKERTRLLADFETLRPKVKSKAVKALLAEAKAEL